MNSNRQIFLAELAHHLPNHRVDAEVTDDGLATMVIMANGFDPSTRSPSNSALTIAERSPAYRAGMAVQFARCRASLDKARIDAAARADSARAEKVERLDAAKKRDSFIVKQRSRLPAGVDESARANLEKAARTDLADLERRTRELKTEKRADEKPPSWSRYLPRERNECVGFPLRNDFPALESEKKK